MIKKILAIIFVFLVISVLFLNGCGETQTHSHGGERCVTDADCPHEGDKCVNGFCSAEGEHAGHTH